MLAGSMTVEPVLQVAAFGMLLDGLLAFRWSLGTHSGRLGRSAESLTLSGKSGGVDTIVGSGRSSATQ